MNKFRVIISYRMTSGAILTWKGEADGVDHPSVAAETIKRVRRLKRRPIAIVGVLVTEKQ